MTTLLQVSDMHFGTEIPAVVEALVGFAQRARPDVLIVSGDITQRARSGQFSAAWRFCERTGVPRVLAVPGNHDIPLFNLPARVFSPYGNYMRNFGHDLEPEYVSPDVLVVSVNTTRWYRHKHGEVGPEQIARVEHRLRSATPRQLRVVVTHQPVHVTATSDTNNLLRGHKLAVDAWARAGAHLILGGHIHLPHIEPVAGMWSVLAGTAVSQRLRSGHPNSVNLIRYSGGECTIERWDYVDNEGFACAERKVPALKFVKAPARGPVAVVRERQGR